MIDNIRLSGIKTNLAMNYFGLEAGGVQNIGFTTKDVTNYLTVKRSLELKMDMHKMYSITLSANKQRTHRSFAFFKLTRKAR